MPNRKSTSSQLDRHPQEPKLDSVLTLDQFVQAARVVFREEGKRLLSEYAAQKPLIAIGDVARTLSVSTRTVETMLAAGELPPPLWVSGQRRWHPDALDAYLRSLEGRARRGPKK